MAEFKHPGIFVEETDAKARPIDGVHTSNPAESGHPGVFVEETGGAPKPIDGVPTHGGDALAPADRPRWAYAIAIGTAALAGVGFWLARFRRK
jgi:hypothetical protein